MAIDELARRIASGNGAIFVGAGLSIGAGMPGWAGLIQPLRERLTELDARQSFPPEQIAEWYAGENGRSDLIGHLQAELDSRRRQPTRSHELLASLPVDLYLTTNFDDLLERSLDAEKIVNDVDFSSLNDKRKKQLIKVHGDLTDRESLVFTRSDYDHYLENRPAIAELIRITLMTRTVLFLGYGFGDRDLSTILGQVRRRLGNLQRPIYTVLLDPNPYAVKELQDKYGVHVVQLKVPMEDIASSAMQPDALKDAYSRRSAKAMETWLSDLKHRVDKERSMVNALQSTGPVSNLPDTGTRFIGRDADIERIIGILKRDRIAGIQGFPGSGKTALATEVAKRCEFGYKADFSRDDLLFAHGAYINARDVGNAALLLDHILDTLAGVFKRPVNRQLDGWQIDAKKNRIGALLKVFGMLIVIDHLPADVPGELWEWIEAIPAPSAVLLVSRFQLSRLREAVQIGGLNDYEAREYIRMNYEEAAQRIGEQRMRQLITTSHGNPQAMKLLVGQISTHGAELAQGSFDMANVCQSVLEDSWQALSVNGRAVMCAASLFATRYIMSSALRRASGIDDDDEFAQAAKECEQLLLLDYYDEPRPGSGQIGGYTIHPMTAILARNVLGRNTAAEHACHHRLAGYYLEFVQRIVVRSNPDVPYWTGLATPAMLEIDDEWPTIRQVVDWTSLHDDTLLVDLVFLLIHYMDTRLYHSERIASVKAAVAALQRQDKVVEEALLRIDALGWTLVETGDFDGAEEQIRHGLDLVQAGHYAQSADLVPLAYTWLARASCERGDMGRATELIDMAIAAASGANAWISYRVHVVAGDLAIKRGDCAAAVDFYIRGHDLVSSYGGEEGWQILPRLGIAYAGSGRTAEAKKVFGRLITDSCGDRNNIGLLYAQYGAAIIDHGANPLPERSMAAKRLDHIRPRLVCGKSPNLLVQLMDTVHTQLQLRTRE